MVSQEQEKEEGGGSSVDRNPRRVWGRPAAARPQVPGRDARPEPADSRRGLGPAKPRRDRKRAGPRRNGQREATGRVAIRKQPLESQGLPHGPPVL